MTEEPAAAQAAPPDVLAADWEDGRIVIKNVRTS